MPVYDYKCATHGIFNALATMADAHKPHACPSCGRLSARIILLAPEVLALSPESRKAHACNEKSQHEPLVSTEDQRKHDTEHQAQCGCHSTKGSGLIYTADGDKMFPSQRPWMISH